MIPVKKISIIEKKIQNDCLKCQGEGCSICRSKISRIKIYAEAGIPMDYWLLSFKDFKGDAKFKESVSEFLQDLNKMYEDGTSLAFVGNFGTGKTYTACCFLKSALILGYSAKYFNMSDIINDLVSSQSSSKYLETLIQADFLAIDEFSKRFVFPSEKSEQLFGQTLEYILRSRFQNKMPTIICSNNMDIDQVLSEDFSKAFSSLRSQYIKVFIVSGKDYRKNGG